MWNSLFGAADADQPKHSETRDDTPATIPAGAGIGTTNDDAFSEPECDYDTNPTQLYKLIENKAWDAAICRVQSCPEEARTWVCRREKKKGGGGGVMMGAGQIRWRLLPIHATCVFKSPLSLIEALIEAYPDGACMKDVSYSLHACVICVHISLPRLMFMLFVRWYISHISLQITPYV